MFIHAITLAVLVGGFAEQLAVAQDEPKARAAEELWRQLAELAAEGQPEGANGWESLMEAGRTAAELGEAAMGAPKDVWFIASLEPSIQVSWWSTVRDFHQEVVEAGAIRLLRDLAAAPQYNAFAIDEDFNVYHCEWLLVALRYSTLLALQRGEIESALDELELVAAIARALSHQPIANIQDVGHDVLDTVHHIVRITLQRGECTKGCIERLIKIVDAVEPPSLERAARGQMLLLRTGIDAHFEGQDRMADDTLRALIEQYQETFTDPHAIKIFAEFRDADLTWEEVEARIEIPDRAAVHAMIERVFAPLIVGASKQRHEREEASVLLPDAPRVLFDELINLAARRVLSLMEVRDRLKVAHAGLRIMLAIEQFRAENEMYPETLDALAPAIRSALPFDPWTGERYRYRRAADGASYTLYSIGANGIDNGGVFDEVSPYSALYQPHLDLDLQIDRRVKVPVIPPAE